MHVMHAVGYQTGAENARSDGWAMGSKRYGAEWYVCVGGRKMTGVHNIGGEWSLMRLSLRYTDRYKVNGA
jgi:hypothetical protein